LIQNLSRILYSLIKSNQILIIV